MDPETYTLPPDPAAIARALFARWYFGHEAIRVVMPDASGDGAVLLAEPIVYSLVTSDMGFIDDDLRRWHHYTGRIRAETLLVILAAALPAAASTRSASEPVLEAGHHEVALLRRAAKTIHDWLPLDLTDAWSIARGRAEALMGAPRAIGAVSEMATLLARQKGLESEEVNGICLLRFRGLQPARNAWSESWPPTLEELRNLHIPLHEGDTAATRARATRSRDVTWYLATIAPRLEAAAMA